MGRRFNSRYFLELSGERLFKLSAVEWQELLSGGWAWPIPERFKTARLTSGVVGWTRGCDLYLLAIARLRTISPSWAHAWLYRVGQIRTLDVTAPLFERQERVMRDLDREIQNDALLWRTFRDRKTKGANSFAWIPPDIKMQIIRALRPEGAILS